MVWASIVFGLGLWLLAGVLAFGAVNTAALQITAAGPAPSIGWPIMVWGTAAWLGALATLGYGVGGWLLFRCAAPDLPAS